MLHHAGTKPLPLPWQMLVPRQPSPELSLMQVTDASALILPATSRSGCKSWCWRCEPPAQPHLRINSNN